jgi:hypothetical protein
MSRSHPPPPTKFGPAGIQAKMTEGTATRAAPPPPPTRFGTTLVQRQAQAGAPPPGLGGKLPDQSRAGIARPAISWPVAAAQAKGVAGSVGQAALKPSSTQFGPSLAQAAVQSVSALGSPSNLVQCHRNPPPPSGPAIQRQPSSQSVIQRRQWCRECQRDVDYSDDHSTRCSRWYRRTFQTVADRNAPTLTRSHSYDRLRSSGSVDRIHQHDNRHQPTSQSHVIGHWDRDGHYTGRPFQ